MNRILRGLLAMVLASSPSWQTDPTETRVGIHVLTSLDSEYAFVTESISKDSISEALSKLDWSNDFVGLSVVTSPGTSMTVSGSLDPEHGLSARYINRTSGIEAISTDAPGSVEELRGILFDFLDSDGAWKDKSSFTYYEIK